MSSASSSGERKQAWEEACEETKKNVARGLLQRWAVRYGGAEDGDELVKALQSLGWRAKRFQSGRWNYDMFLKDLLNSRVLNDDAREFLDAIEEVSPSNRQQHSLPTNGGSGCSHGEGKEASPNTYAPPLTVKAPSKSSANDHKDCLNKGRKLVDIAWVVDALRAFYGDAISDDKKSGAEDRRDAENIHKATVEGIPRYREKEREVVGAFAPHDGEVSLASRFFSAFHRWFIGTEVQGVTWCHEHRLYEVSPVDIVAFKKYKGVQLPLILFECVLQSTSTFPKKLQQLRSQVRNAFNVWPPRSSQIWPSILGVIFDVSSFAFEVFHYGCARGKFNEIRVCSGKSKDDLPNMLALIRYWCANEEPTHSILSHKATKGNVTVWESSINGVEQKKIRKFYDYRYRKREVKEEDRRWPNSALFEEGLEATEVVCSDDLSILEYRFIDGTHVASNSDQFASVWRALQKIHNKGWVHADIRESNIVFCKGEEEQKCIAQLIDFDLSRKIDEPYVRGYSTNIDDGKRHDEARAEKPVKTEHDFYSLGCVMELYVASEDTRKGEWNKLLSDVRDRKSQIQWPETPISLNRQKTQGGTHRGTGSLDPNAIMGENN